MNTLNKKLRNNIMYLFISIIITISLPILLKNGWACLIGVAALILFSFQTYVMYKKIKNADNLIILTAECLKKSSAGMGTYSYARKCEFKPDENEWIEDNFSLTIAINDKSNSKDRMKEGSKYEFVFDKKTDEDDNFIINNSTLITFAGM